MSGARPRWHFTPRSGWINDPLAVTWHRGLYHLFFQYVPDRVEWAAECQWGHATSPDLVEWTEQPVALIPADDETGAWSGDLVIDDAGVPVILYTSVGPGPLGVGRVRLAWPDTADWTTWTPGDVVATAPDSLELIDFRDPALVRTANGYRMVVGARAPEATAALLGYSSPDLRTWTYDGVLASRPAADDVGSATGAMWECPQLIEVDSRLTLIVSAWDREQLTHVAAAPVVWVGNEISVGAWQTLSYGTSYYAATAFTDIDGRACLMYWLREVGDPDAGWAGAHSVPHVLSWSGERLVARPHPAVRAAAGSNWQTTTPGPEPSATTFGTVAVVGTELRLTSTAGQVSMPYVGGPVGVLTDGPTVEVFTDAGVASFPI